MAGAAHQPQPCGGPRGEGSADEPPRPVMGAQWVSKDLEQLSGDAGRAWPPRHPEK